MHCSLTSFFTIQRDDLPQFIQHFTSFAALHSDSPIAQSVASTSAESSPTSCVLPFKPRYDLRVGEVVVTNDGCVILSLSSLILRSLMHAFCVSYDSLPVKPKAVGHLTLARGRVDNELAQIHQLYQDKFKTALLDPGVHTYWDVVLLELIGGERSRTSTSALQFKELHRVPLGSL